MDIRAMANQAVQVVNEDISATFFKCDSFTTLADGSRIPNYLNSVGLIQVQGLDSDDLKHVDGLNLQGQFRKIFAQGAWTGIIRADQEGADMFDWGDGKWKVVRAVNWSDWSECIVCLQL